MVSVSHMEHLDPGITSGHFLEQFSPIVVLVRVRLLFHHSLAMIISVRLVMTTLHLGMTGRSFLMTLSGMVKTVEQLLVPVSVQQMVPPGSASSCPRPQPTTSKFVFVAMMVLKTLLMRTLQWNLSNSSFVNKLNTNVCEY